MKHTITIDLTEEALERITESLEVDLDLQLPLGFEERDVLKRLATVSIGLYIMEMRESVTKTPNTIQ